jgi:hypothetical protein
MESPLLQLLISSRSINKHGHHRQFLFLIGRFLKIFYSDTAWLNGPKRGRKHISGADPGGGGGAPVERPPKIGKNMIFWRKIVIFHTKYPKYVRASLRSAQFF